MKDWKIKNGELLHLPCKENWISMPDEEGHWICLYCEEHAPEEIEFCAMLANCRRFPIEDWRELLEKHGWRTAKDVLE